MPLVAIGWSEELVMEAWHSDREAACEKAGLKEEDSGQSSPVAAASPEDGVSSGQDAQLEVCVCVCVCVRMVCVCVCVLVQDSLS